MKLLLVYPEIECSVTNTSTYTIPLGLGSIATYCKERLGDSLEVRILDGSMMAHQEQLDETQKFKPDFIGISPTIASQGNAYEIAQAAHNLGSKVYFGGVNSTNLWRNMLANRDFIDGVVLFEGEQAMFNLLKGKIGPNVAYRDKNGNVCPPSGIEVMDLADLPDIDYSLFELDRFFEQTQKRGFGKAISYYAGKGCSKRGGAALKGFYSLERYNHLVQSMPACTFCGRNEVGLRDFDEDREARIVQELHDKYGVKGFFNVQDTVNLRNESPVGLEDSWFRLFIGTENITSKNIAKLKQRYGPNLIFQAGIESADPRMRRAYGKAETNTADMLTKVELMLYHGIQLHASFILGGRGETEESMRETTELARKLVDYDNVTWVLISPQLILPGSPDYRELLKQDGMHEKYADEDLIDIVEINQDFLRQFAPSLTRAQIIEEIRKTFENIRRKTEKPVLDVKGVVKEEEKYVKPSRRYSE